MTLEFFLACIPPKTTSQMKRAVRTPMGIRFFKGKSQREAESALAALLMPHRPASPLVGVVSLSIEITWPWRAEDLSTKAKRAEVEAVGRRYKDTKPDCDNVSKGITDLLSRLGFIEGDEKVAALSVKKYHGGTPGVWVRIETI